MENKKGIIKNKEFAVFGINIYNKLNQEGLNYEEFFNFVIKKKSELKKQLNLINKNTYI